MQNMATISQKGNRKPPTAAQDAATRVWQKFLNISVDGSFGPNTHAATVAYQRAHKLEPDGVVGPKTWATVPDPKLGQAPSPQQVQIAAANAATVASNTIAKPPVKPTPAPAAPKPPAPVVAPSPGKRPLPTAAQIFTNPVASVQQAAAAAQQSAARVQVVVQKQPLWVRIAIAAGVALGSIAGFKALLPEKRKAA